MELDEAETDASLCGFLPILCRMTSRTMEILMPWMKKKRFRLQLHRSMMVSKSPSIRREISPKPSSIAIPIPYLTIIR